MQLTYFTKRQRIAQWFKHHTFPLILSVCIFIYVLSLLLPVLWVLLTSFKTYKDFLEAPFGSIKELTFNNYVTVWKELKFMSAATDGGRRVVYIEEMLFNSLAFAFGLPIFSIIPICSVGYVMAKYKFRFNKVLMFLIIMVMTMPSIGGVSGELAMLKVLNIYNTYLGLACLKFTFATTWTLIYYAAYEGIPWDYAEAVFIDGGNHFTVFFRIMLPFVRSFNITFFILMMMSHWVDHNLSLYYCPSMPGLAYGLFYAKFSLPAIQRETTSFAASIMLAIPTIIIYVSLSNVLMGEHMQIGGLKG